MIDCETELRERIKDLSKEEAIELLESMEFNINMKDVWGYADYARMDAIHVLLGELKNAE